MVHQWWSPKNLGCGDYQTDLIRYYLDKSTGDGATCGKINKVQTHWHDVKEKWDTENGAANISASRHRDNDNFDGPGGYWSNKTWNDNFDYENYGTTWWGSGQSINTNPISWKKKDLKSWIAWEAPVVITVHSGGDGNVGSNHCWVVVGYDDTRQSVGIIDPNGWYAGIAYADFDNYWRAPYLGGRLWRR